MATDTKTNLFCDASLLVRRGDAGRAAPLAASRLLITAGGWRSGLRARHEMSYHSKHLWKSVSLSDSAGPTRQARIQATKAEQARGRILRSLLAKVRRCFSVDYVAAPEEKR